MYIYIFYIDQQWMFHIVKEGLCVLIYSIAFLQYNKWLYFECCLKVNTLRQNFQFL